MAQEEFETSRLERILAYSAVTIILFGVLSFFATLIAALVGVSRETLATAFWPVVTWVGYVGIPAGFLLVLVLILVTRRRRLREIASETDPK